MSYPIMPKADITNVFDADYVSESEVETSDDEAAFDRENDTPAGELEYFDCRIATALLELEDTIGEDKTVCTTVLHELFNINKVFVNSLPKFIEIYNEHIDTLADQEKDLFMMSRKLQRIQRRLVQERRSSQVDLQRADARYRNENHLYQMCSEELEACLEELCDVKKEYQLSSNNEIYGKRCRLV